jgi:hypothetical protein
MTDHELILLSFARMPRPPVLARRHRLWPTVSVAVPLRRVEKGGEASLPELSNRWGDAPGNPRNGAYSGA